MKFTSPALTVFLCAIVVFVSSCSTQDVQERQDKMTNSYENRQEKREIRNEARQDRSDAWFNRVMGEPVKGGDTGLKLPQ